MSKPEVSQMTIRDLAGYSRGLVESLATSPDAEKLRPALAEALSAECVQCAIRVDGADLLKLGAEEPQEDPRLERLRIGYCARNGCESQFYNVTRAPHPQINWATLFTAIDPTTEQKAAARRAVRMDRLKRTGIRTAIAVAALLIVFILRQLYVGGTIPLIRQPENFQVDRTEP